MGHPLIRGRDRNWTGRFSRRLFSPDHFGRGVARLKSWPVTKHDGTPPVEGPDVPFLWEVEVLS
jgi:hypothetical protein